MILGSKRLETTGVLHRHELNECPINVENIKITIITIEWGGSFYIKSGFKMCSDTGN